MKYFEISSKTGDNVDETFTYLGRQMNEKNKQVKKEAKNNFS
jgi:hypothetical protein